MYDGIILLGVLVSLAFTELTGLSAGLIVPGYLVLCFESPQRIRSRSLCARWAFAACLRAWLSYTAEGALPRC